MNNLHLTTEVINNTKALLERNYNGVTLFYLAQAEIAKCTNIDDLNYRKNFITSKVSNQDPFFPEIELSIEEKKEVETLYNDIKASKKWVLERAHEFMKQFDVSYLQINGWSSEQIDNINDFEKY